MPRPTSKTARESSIRKRLHSIIEDRISGAAEIENKIVRLFEDLSKRYQKDTRKELRMAIDRIRIRFSTMANILNLAIFAERLSDSEEPDRIYESLKGYRKDIERNRKMTVARTARRIKVYGSIFTLSGSSSVLKAVQEAGGMGWKGVIRIIESRPKNEGTEFAKKTAGAGNHTVLGVDTQIPGMIRDSGAVFLGADAVTEKYFVNKTGSDIAVEYADKYGKTVYVVADSSKFITNRVYKYRLDRNPDNEIIPKKTRNLEIINNYFEKVIPRGKVHFISGNKIIKAPDIKNLLNRQR